MKDSNCGYCVGGEPLAKFGIKICDLEVSQLILFKEQSHPGRCIVAYKDHVSEIVDISEEDRNAFFADVNRAAKAIHAAFNPDKVNYGMYGDTGHHLHMHLVPKYKDEFEWGGTKDKNAGLKFVKYMREQVFSVPVILQSTEDVEIDNSPANKIFFINNSLVCIFCYDIFSLWNFYPFF